MTLECHTEWQVMASEGGDSGAPTPLEPVTGESHAPAETCRSLHARSFKLRFASHREPGRSYVSLVKPLGLPATVTGKFYRSERPTRVDEEDTQRALQKIQHMFERGPREKYDAPRTSAQVYGWYGAGEDAALVRADRRLSHHIRDSAWLRDRLCVLAADDKLKHR